MPPVKYELIHAFVPSGSNPSLSGNPAAVLQLSRSNDPSCSLASAIPTSQGSLKSLFPPDEHLHNIAKELDLPMTSFVIPLNAPNTFALRWFYSGGEAPMCGHGTVAAAHQLLSQGTKSPITLHTVNAVLQAEQTVNGIKIQLPADTQFDDAPQDTEHIMKKIFNGGDVKPRKVSVIGAYSMIELDSEVDMQNLKIDFEALKQAKTPTPNLRIFQIAPPPSSETGPHLRSRVFNYYPSGEFAEDAATGSAHAAIIPLVLTSRLSALISCHPDLKSQDPVRVLRIRQCSERGGEMVATWDDEAGVVMLEGNAIHISQGEVNLG
ncbi:hypothetical protein BD324DRAFT_639512 [Kockovaella imperatae]|uniref:Diaminopimelate epimerase-like protein n=1 Tax=Kockovaella imperatae TaxID=4999 RepID=A0A1Y1U6F1_9TREE|nr:hypothetical protein BD324DRAFT_639512 [Kockovaella imperatae]ORX33609.1 hypothetical protein BD324DRAFT_639512 [Kockovaella imperatae]